MRVISVDDLAVPAGRLQVLVPTASAAEPNSTPPSFNQRNHLATASASGGWLAATFELNTGLLEFEMPALERAFVALVRRHETLRTSFANDREMTRMVHVEPLSWRTESFALVGDLAQRQARFRRVVDSYTRPWSFPAWMLGVIRTADNPIVVAAFNHIHVDAMSLAVAVRDLLAAYRGEELEATLSFVDYCAEPREAKLSDATGVATWHSFLEANGGGLPRFPADLGLEPGQRVPQRAIVRELLSDDQADAVEQGCLAAGGRMSSGVFAVCAAAAASLPESPGWPLQEGDGGSLSTLLAVSTRRDARWAGSLGWFVTNVPIEIPVCDTLHESVAATQSAVDAALQLAELPLSDVVASYPGQLELDRDVFMISYLDYRRTAAAQDLSAHNAHHVSASTPADNVQVWFSRTDRGLAVRTRLPDTAAATAAVETWLDAVADGLHTLSTEPQGVVAWR
jgi:condensation domain-containing protein